MTTSDILIETAGLMDSDAACLSRLLHKKNAEWPSPKGSPPFRLRFEKGASMPEEAFEIRDIVGGVCIAASSLRGFVYGLGKLLRGPRQSGGGSTLSSWRGVSRPDKPIRGIYFATHFHNYYHEAPLEEIADYIEDLALCKSRGQFLLPAFSNCLAIRCTSLRFPASVQ